MRFTRIKQGSETPTDDGDQYTGWDRFGRAIDLRWFDGGGTHLERLQHAYDRASNRLYRANLVAAGRAKQEELYGYDGLYQLEDFKRGELNSRRTAISGTPAAEESFTFDPTGNWSAAIRIGMISTLRKWAQFISFPAMAITKHLSPRKARLAVLLLLSSFLCGCTKSHRIAIWNNTPFSIIVSAPRSETAFVQPGGRSLIHLVRENETIVIEHQKMKWAIHGRMPPNEYVRSTRTMKVHNLQFETDKCLYLLAASASKVQRPVPRQPPGYPLCDNRIRTE